MAEQTYPADDPAAALDSLEAIAVFLADAFDAGDAACLTGAMGIVARAPAMPELAAATGLPRHELARSLDSGEFSLDATLAIMKVVDLHLPGR